jgi:hypothetical protein
VLGAEAALMDGAAAGSEEIFEASSVGYEVLTISPEVEDAPPDAPRSILSLVYTYLGHLFATLGSYL